MTLERESGSQNPSELLRGKNYIIADTFIVRINDSSDKEAEEKVRTSLSDQGVTDPVTIIFCKSPEEQIREIIKFLINQKALSASHDPWMYIVGFDVVKLQSIIPQIETMFEQKDSVVKNIDPGNITILQLNALSHMNSRPRKSRINIAALTEGETAFPTHPTPAH